MKTVGILYPGDMGHSVVKVLRGDGFPVVTSLFGRSERTRRLSRSAHFDECAGVDSLVDVADVISVYCAARGEFGRGGSSSHRRARHGEIPPVR